ADAAQRLFLCDIRKDKFLELRMLYQQKLPRPVPALKLQRNFLHLRPISQQRFQKSKEGRLNPGFAPNVGIPPIRGHVSFISCGQWSRSAKTAAMRDPPAALSAVRTSLNGRPEPFVL